MNDRPFSHPRHYRFYSIEVNFPFSASVFMLLPHLNQARSSFGKMSFLCFILLIVSQFCCAESYLSPLDSKKSSLEAVIGSNLHIMAVADPQPCSDLQTKVCFTAPPPTGKLTCRVMKHRSS